MTDYTDDEDELHIYTEDDFDIRISPAAAIGAGKLWDWQLWNNWTNRSCGMNGFLPTADDAKAQAIAHRDATIEEWNADTRKKDS